MKISDLVELDEPTRVTYLWHRLIPLAAAGYPAFPLAVKDFYTVFELLGEVANGALHQYFCNSSGDRAMDALASLERLNAAGPAKLLRQSFTIFGSGEPPDRNLRTTLLNDATPDALKRLEQCSAGISDASVELTSSLARRVVEHAADFAFLDRYPSGFKATVLEDGIDIEPFLMPPPYPVVVVARAVLHDRAARAGAQPFGEAERDFLDVFAFADVVSAKGFPAYFFTRDADNHQRTAAILDRMGLSETAKLLRQAVAMLPKAATTHLQRRAWLNALTEEGLKSLSGLSGAFQAQRLAVAEALTRHVIAHREAFKS